MAAAAADAVNDTPALPADPAQGLGLPANDEDDDFAKDDVELNPNILLLLRTLRAIAESQHQMAARHGNGRMKPANIRLEQRHKDYKC